MSATVARAVPNSCVDSGAPLSPAAALLWLAEGDRVHSLLGRGGCNMDRCDVEVLIARAPEAGLLPASSISHAHAMAHNLAVWSSHADIADGGYWLFFKTRSAEPPA